ncbi:MAG: ATP synthase F1 subunit delta [Dehalococcoidales bacterium]|jgi:F-type H+-transporting ATPase subunit delta|nr:ATP synthase F1 subunit delta [Dehalococcoidales bacterium]
MARKISVRCYAQAMFDLGLEKEQLDCWQSDIEKVTGLGRDVTIAAYLGNPKVNFEDKARLLAEMLGDIDPLVLNIVYLLLAKGKLNMMADIANEYQRLLDNHHGIEQAEVITAVPLDDEAKLKLSQHLGDIVGKKIVLKIKVDHGIIGGFVARVAGKLVDGSTRNKLATLKKEMA